MESPRFLSRDTRMVAMTILLVFVMFLGVFASPSAAKDAMASSSTLDCASPGLYDDQTATGSMYNVVQHIGADRAWARRHTGKGIDVALIDTGTVPVQGLHADGKIVHGPDLSFDAPFDEARNLDTYGHGTHMAGIIAGNDHDRHSEWVTSGEFQGVAPDARIVDVKVGDHTGAVDVSQVIAAIDWVVQHRNENGLNVRVINLSYRTSGTQPYQIDPLAKAVENAWDHGIVVVVAAGNDGHGESQLGNPAYDPYVIAVGALHERASQPADWDQAGADGRYDNCLDSDQKWAPTRFTTWAGAGTRSPDVYAPGTTIVSLRNPGSRVDVEHPAGIVSDRFTKGSGSSQAAAVVSGAVAVLLDARPELTPDEVKALLMTSGELVSSNRRMIDLGAAIEAKVPADAEQTWPKSDGSGSLEASRGDDHVVIGDRKLTGEVTAFGGDWDAKAWAEASTAGTSWSGSSWSGSSWSGSSWSGSSWSGSSWSGSSWSGSSWSGSSWSGSSWSGSSWSGSSWSGSSWT